ncbi:Nucleotide-binding universal stress protein, UspA family [Desulfacinum hydrothermale DSM 13146]|uniref:Universal stress protein n=1 Tax=Desulfacinum hydrothermale DSM 13146 TaxID=1121390 RepID=A0A1W1X521_9BACT|nr:universal stress protein [Desulfacinum hydrothermale]SMC18818.1 Nucleotide-binding universal stress protein, UspA family [Desulfacinum hydrothermale DSM 13146]
MGSSLYRHIAYCTDFSENADQAFVAAKDLAWRYGAVLHLVHVMVTYSTAPIREMYVPLETDAHFVEKATEAARSAIMERYVAQLEEKQPYEIHLLSGYPASEIVAFAQKNNVDLLVTGSHGLTGLAHVLFGSTADRVVRKAPCSVLTVRLQQTPAQNG